MRKKSLSLFLLALVFFYSNVVWGITPAEIMKQVDEYQHLKSARVESTMIISKGNRKMIKKMTSFIKGSSRALTKFNNPRDRGTKFLKRNDNLWMFFPDAEDIVKISGHMLEQGMMGSDYSYDDIMESSKLTKLYKFKIIREEKFNSRTCYVIEGIKKEGSNASYYRRLSWIDKERFVVLQDKLYARSGRLLKVIKAKKVEKIGKRWFVTLSVVDNKLKRGTKTKYKVNSIEFGIDLPESKFSLRSLRR